MIAMNDNKTLLDLFRDAMNADVEAKRIIKERVASIKAANPTPTKQLVNRITRVTGVVDTTAIGWLSGRWKPTAPARKVIAAELGIPEEQLFNYECNENA